MLWLMSAATTTSTMATIATTDRPLNALSLMCIWAIKIKRSLCIGPPIKCNENVKQQTIWSDVVAQQHPHKQVKNCEFSVQKPTRTIISFGWFSCKEKYVIRLLFRIFMSYSCYIRAFEVRMTCLLHCFRRSVINVSCRLKGKR